MSNESYLKMPIDIEKEMFALIKRSYIHAVSEIGDQEFKYIDSRISDKIASAKKDERDWVIRLSKQYECLHKCLKQSKAQNISISKHGKKQIGAALFYFINPYDVIQDFVENIGYADDYYVFILCIEGLSNKDKKLIKIELSNIS